MQLELWLEVVVLHLALEVEDSSWIRHCHYWQEAQVQQEVFPLLSSVVDLLVSAVEVWLPVMVGKPGVERQCQEVELEVHHCWQEPLSVQEVQQPQVPLVEVHS